MPESASKVLDRKAPTTSYPKIKDLPVAVNPSEQKPHKVYHTFVIERNVVINFPDQLPAGVKVDKEGNVYVNETLIFRKDVSCSVCVCVCV